MPAHHSRSILFEVRAALRILPLLISWRDNATGTSVFRGIVYAIALMTGCTSACLAMPPSKDARAVNGELLFSQSGCAHCHGDHGQGGEIGPSLLGVSKRLKPDNITAQIHNGGKAMPAFGDVLSGDKIDDLVVYLRTLRPAQKQRASR